MLKITILLSVIIAFLYAVDNPEDILNSLQDDLLAYKQIATDTKENVDYMPYVVSVLTHENLIKLGVLTLREAITLIPGVDISIGATGVKNPVFRGSNPFAMAQSKLLIDGVLVNNQFLGAYTQYLDMPIDIIQRIEVVRGPGSLDSSVNAYAGSINVITKASQKSYKENENSVFAAFGSNNYKMAGFVGGIQGRKFCAKQ